LEIMAEEQMLEVQQGIWIDVRWLQQAGLGSRYQVVVLPGEIRILGVWDDTRQETPSEKEWNTLRSLGSDAGPGQLQNAAAEHDRYLYGKGR
jgi:hypothetical protein